MILENISLGNYNTFHINCNARYVCILESVDDWFDLINRDDFGSLPYLILGGGSNILFGQDKYLGFTIVNRIKGKDIIDETDTEILIKVGAGESWDDFVWRALDKGFCGLENLVSIPGTIGATPIQNIGAYGVEVCKFIESVDCIDCDANSFSILGKDCQFAYRDSIFKHSLRNILITNVTYRLQKYNPNAYNPDIHYAGVSEYLLDQDILNCTPVDIASAIQYIRSTKLPNPDILGNAGSFFKNPIVNSMQFECLKHKFSGLIWHQTKLGYKLSAGQLIDLAGCKGLRHDTVGTYDHHALILVNYGGGTGEDIIRFYQYIQKKVYDLSGIWIEPEVNIIGI